jgi:tRNA (guanine-N7-)-methyltransferase
MAAENSNIPPVKRKRLYGRRTGKPLRASRQALLDALLPDLLIELPSEGGLATKDLFAQRRDEACADCWLEIGFGKGEHLAWQAIHNPDVTFIGCEPYISGMASLVAQIDAGKISNVRLYDDDATLLLEALEPGSLSRVFLLFSDPWPKKRHHKRRFVNHSKLDLFAKVLKSGGELRIATDHAEYGNWIVRHMVKRDDFDWKAECATDWRERTPDWPPTRYEKKAIEQGRTAIYLRYLRQ